MKINFHKVKKVFINIYPTTSSRVYLENMEGQPGVRASIEKKEEPKIAKKQILRSPFSGVNTLKNAFGAAVLGVAALAPHGDAHAVGERERVILQGAAVQVLNSIAGGPVLRQVQTADGGVHVTGGDPREVQRAVERRALIEKKPDIRVDETMKVFFQREGIFPQISDSEWFIAHPKNNFDKVSLKTKATYQDGTTEYFKYTKIYINHKKGNTFAVTFEHTSLNTLRASGEKRMFFTYVPASNAFRMATPEEIQ